jgi:hypothetical protein
MQSSPNRYIVKLESEAEREAAAQELGQGTFAMSLQGKWIQGTAQCVFRARV